jgi:hypothetical protein
VPCGQVDVYVVSKIFRGRDIDVRCSNLSYFEVAEELDHIVEKVGVGYEKGADQYEEEPHRNGAENTLMVSS